LKTTNSSSKGKSVLQNEIVGDLDNEFGNLPDNAESIPLDELGSLLQTTYNGDLGKQTSLLIAKMMSMKMPAGFSAGVAKTHMEVRWGLGPQRQKSVMVTAVIRQPASRISSEIEAKKFFDDVAGTYASLAGIDLSSSNTESEDAGPGLTLDPAALDALTEHQKRLNLRQYELLGQHLCLDTKATDEALLGMLSLTLKQSLISGSPSTASFMEGVFFRNLLAGRCGSTTHAGIGYTTMFYVFTMTCFPGELT